MFIFPRENNTGLPPVPFHYHSPLQTLKATDISVELNRMQCKQTDLKPYTVSSYVVSNKNIQNNFVVIEAKMNMLDSI